mmetsp:Transcript_20396/g.36617  ORF Transcript_20396/g.36617 Transcript_20396/m.36617 type:complete len:205 (-) Transcript_20396:523-1137(-)
MLSPVSRILNSYNRCESRRIARHINANCFPKFVNKSVLCFEPTTFFFCNFKKVNSSSRKSVVPSSSGTDLPSSTSDEKPKPHAFLHDFCITIPYGAFVLVNAIIFYLAGLVDLAAVSAVSSATIAMASVLSLKTWRRDESSTMYTLVAAGTTSFLAYLSISKMLSISGLRWLLCLISGFLAGVTAAFCVYNVMAGGNPPRRGTH